MSDEKEQAFLRGRRAALTKVISTCLMELGYEGHTVASMAVEREQTISMLRSVCDDHGDNDWDETLHLADVVDKHLRRHLNEDRLDEDE